jgi:hypothetical protein
MKTCMVSILAEDIVDPQTGEIYAEAGDEITGKLLEELVERGYHDLTILDIDHVNTAPIHPQHAECRQERVP